MTLAESQTTTATSKPRPVTISRLVAQHVRVPLRKTIRHASHVRDASDNVVVRCVLSDGTVGFGEGVPRSYVTGETIETSLTLLRQADWAWACEDVADFAAGVSLARRIDLPRPPEDDRGIVGNAARCAVELAVLDAFGRAFGVPLRDVPRHTPDLADLADVRGRCRYSGVITSKPSKKKEAFSVLKQRLFWFKDIKIKVGTEGQDDVARLRLFRKLLGGRRRIRIDANEAWPADQAAERIRELEPFGIASVEQPVPHEEADRLAEIRRAVKTPIMLDESLCGLVDAQAAVDGERCDIFNLRLSKCGGLLPTLELAAFALRHGLKYQLGCQVGETGILSAAGRAFACGVKPALFVEGSYDSFLVRDALTKEDLTFGFGGWAPALTAPGLGITVEPHRLEATSVAEVALHG